MMVWGALLSLTACQEAAQTKSYQELNGQTMGTTYVVKYADREGRDFQKDIDSLLVRLNEEVSTYIPTSTISLFNQSVKGLAIKNDSQSKVGTDYPHFQANLNLAREIAVQTKQYFQPTIMPLVNYWGFGYTEKRAITKVDSTAIDSLIRNVGLEYLAFRGDSIIKHKPGVQLDFSAIAKGYGVDQICNFLIDKGIEDVFVEIGGEVRTAGVSPRGDAWRIGISIPKPEAILGNFAATAPLDNQAIATSGNYRNYYEVAGEKYGHTINPFTGFPEKSNLLSASVFAPDCATADAFATAFMVMGLEKALTLAEEKTELEAYFIVGMPDGSMETYFSSGLQDIFGKD